MSLDLAAILERAALLDARDYGHAADRLLQIDVPEMAAEIERLRANQLPEGGTWVTEYRHRNAPDREPVTGWVDYDNEQCAANGCEQRRVYEWVGPAGLVATVAARVYPDGACPACGAPNMGNCSAHLSDCPSYLALEAAEAAGGDRRG